MNKKPNITKESAKKYRQGTFHPKHPEKYMGSINNIIYRSSWEYSFLKWCDENPSVLKYVSEEVVIPYYDIVDNKTHRYYMDFAIEVKQYDGTKKVFLVEIKPYAQTQLPKTPKSGMLTESYQKDIATYLKNQQKWEAAKKYCSEHGFGFMIITERELFNKK